MQTNATPVTKPMSAPPAESSAPVSYTHLDVYKRQVQRSAELLGGCGFSKTDELHALAPLMRSNLAHVIEHGAVSALTGPIERGDTQTVQKHLSCLTERDDRQLYALLGLEQVKMAQEKHPEQDYGTLAALLNREKEQNE